jgi:hypothetical protein
MIGNFNLIGSLPHRSFHELAKKYEPTVKVKFGSIAMVRGSSAEVAEAILQKPMTLAQITTDKYTA